MTSEQSSFRDMFEYPSTILSPKNHNNHFPGSRWKKTTIE